MLFDGIARRMPGQFGEAEGTATPPVSTKPAGRRLRIGLALGGGAARGWAHIGVLRVLDAAGIKPDVIAGCSIGAVIGGCYAAGKLDEIEAFARSLTRRRMMRLLDFSFSGSGLIGGTRLQRLLEAELGRTTIEALPVHFGAVATELSTGHEIWLTRGPVIDALRASYALPGIFDPVRLGGRWLMDGALVNPVPVTVARSFGADLVICVNLNGELRLRGTVIQSQSDDLTEDLVEGAADPQIRRLFSGFRGARARRAEHPGAPGIAAVMVDAYNIIQDRISRSRLAGDPPDVMVAPKLRSIGLFEFHRADECIERGREAAQRTLSDIKAAIEETAPRPHG